MKIRKCEMCENPATRITVKYILPNRHVSIWQNFKRKYFHYTSARKSYVCDECFFECHYGLYTLKCKKCNKEFKIDADEYYHENKIKCPFCGKVIRK